MERLDSTGVRTKGRGVLFGKRIVIAAVVMASFVVANTALASPPSGEGRPEPIKACTPPKSLKCAPELNPETKPQKPERPITIPKPTCRDLSDDKAMVECVLNENNMAWVWTSGVADCIIEHESGWDVWARGAEGEYGLWQIHPVNWVLIDKYGGVWWNPVTITSAAIALYRASGYSFNPWTAYRYHCS